MKRLWRRLTFLFRRDRFERDLEEEMSLHLRLKVEENLEAGMTAAQAERTAAARFGNRILVRENARDVWAFRMLEQLVQDARYGARMLRRTPGFTVAAVLSLALGIGPNVAAFQVLNEALLKGPTARDAGRLVQVQTGRFRQISYPNYRDLAESGIFEGLGGYTVSRESWTAAGETRTVSSHLVTGNFFEVLGVGAAAGRTFTAAEVKPEGNPHVVVVTHGFWQRRLARDPGAVGRDLILNGRPFTVVGVLPESHRSLAELGEAPEIYVPLGPSFLREPDNRGQGFLIVVGRLPAGASARSAAAALTVVAERLEQAYPEANRDSTPARAYALTGWGRLERYDDKVWTLAGLMLGVVGLVLLIACANVGGLLLARAVSRRREIAMRLALGAGRRRLVRQFLTESLLLASAACGVGLLVNTWATHLLSRLSIVSSASIPLDPVPDSRILVFAIAIATAATLLCGLAPALHGTRMDLVPALKEEGRSEAFRRFSLRRLMVAGQVAGSTLLLVIGALFLRSLASIATVAPGFDVEHTVVARVELPKGKYNGAAEQLFLATAMARLEETPGIRSATCAGIVPLSFAGSGAAFRVEGGEDRPGRNASLNVVGRRYFETLGIPILRGREFSASDRTGAPPVAIVNETFVRQFFPGSWPERSPVGMRVVRGDGRERDSFEIVGVVGDSKYFSLGERPEPQVYLSYLQPNSVARVRTLVVRADDAASVLSPVKRVLDGLEPSAELEIRIMRDHLSRAFWPSRIGAFLVGSLGVVGLLLAVVGLYGVISYTVSRRSSEIALRMALGSPRGAVLRLVLADGLKLVTGGTAAGLSLSALVTQPLGMFLASDVKATDASSFGAVLVLMLAVGLAAVLVPARRATRIEPMEALRYE